MIYRFRHFELNEGEREFRRGGEQVPLQPLVFDLLALLVRNHRRVVPKDELLERLWPDAIVTEASLQRAISIARSALEDDSHAFIRTFRGRGYRLCAEVQQAEEPPDAGPEAPADGALPETRFCTAADETRIAYARVGGGRGLPLVMVHDWPASFERDLKEPRYHTLVQELCNDRTVVRFDRRGVGSSQRHVGDAGFRLETQVNDLASVIDRLELHRFHLLGWGDGASMCASYAVQHESRVSRMVLWAPYARCADRIEREKVLATAQLARGNWPMATRALADVTFPTGPVEMQVLLSHYFREAFSPEVAADYLEYEAGLDATEIVTRVPAPTLVLHRRGDRNVPIRAGRAVAALIPDCRFVALDGDVAYLGWEPHETARLIRDFLEEDEAADTPPAATSRGKSRSEQGASPQK